ncbi:MAG TPA: hypothetical protein VJ179_01760, partial [Patescibacteria group bacterium]|nr:hypothetical protein [Patescibacteria group bacterium]
SWERFVVPGGIVAVHDSLFWPGVYKFITDFILSGLYDTIDTFYEKGGKGLTYGHKTKKLVPMLKRYWNIVHFLICARHMAWLRWKLMVNMLDEDDVRFKMAALLSKLKGQKAQQRGTQRERRKRY